MSNQPPPPGPVLNYQPPQKGPSHNKWWMVALRIFGGIFAGIVSGIAGLFLATWSDNQTLFLIPPTLVFAGLLVVCIKYRRFGYVTGFVIAPFLVIVGLVVTLAIICGSMGHGHP